MPYVLVADIVAQRRDEDGWPVLPAVVHGEIEKMGKDGVTMRGRPVDAAGELGAEVDIPKVHWRRMTFPMASKRHPHDTFWRDTGKLAYAAIMAPECLQATIAPKRRSGRKELPVWALVERPAFEWLAEYGVPVEGDGGKAEFGRYLASLVESHKESVDGGTIKRHVNKLIEEYQLRHNRGA
jgi:hypothetical protein